MLATGSDTAPTGHIRRTDGQLENSDGLSRSRNNRQHRSVESLLVTIGTGAADRVERFLAAHPTGPLVVCVGSASVAGIVWLAEHCRGRPVTLVIGDMKSRNFALATDRDRSAALDFVNRTDVDVRNWYRTKRSSQGRSEAHLKVWAACTDTGAPQAFLVGSANLTTAGLHENVELMALADASEHAYLRSTLQQLQGESWDAKERLEEWIEHGDSPERSHRPTRRRSDHTPSTRGKPRPHAAAASTGCGSQVLAMVSLTAAAAAVLIGRSKLRR